MNSTNGHHVDPKLVRYEPRVPEPTGNPGLKVWLAFFGWGFIAIAAGSILAFIP